MEILNYTEEHRIFRESVRKFLEKEVSPYVEEWEEARIVPRCIWKKMGDQGFLCMDVSEEYGGKPLLVAGAFGKGRSLAWTSDIGPHWLPNEFVEWQGYARLWRQMLNWLAKR